MSDLDGRFTLSVSEGATVKISYIGFVTQTLKPAGSKPLRVCLQEDRNNLNEVVVIGYGSSRRKDITGSVASVKVRT